MSWADIFHQNVCNHASKTITTRSTSARTMTGVTPSATPEDPKKPVLAHPSVIRFPHRSNHAIVHTQPANPPTFLPVRCQKALSPTMPSAIISNETTILHNSVRPLSGMRTTWCNTAETKNAPTIPPTRPKTSQSG
ncbi:hypothetical protein PAXINDRAFT_98479 [Paxillus involutus ATCC 200175]|nr:hypothetical protein PAXINDRAFT_98479 [Paxillus involutus ATCC 200175]